MLGLSDAASPDAKLSQHRLAGKLVSVIRHTSPDVEAKLDTAMKVSGATDDFDKTLAAFESVLTASHTQTLTAVNNYLHIFDFA
mmetsp:Transcript_67970/g.112994  ORF Transcript_67970/g.112994 Transcript_67970/m.112994 type:complete len:84 (-) Transcript_67970:138-389(-)